MIITKTVNVDLWIRERIQQLHAVQGDSGTRKVTVKLFANREPWVPEGEVSVAIRYRKPDGTAGSYDTMPNGEVAWELTENAVSFLLAPQMLTVPGRVEVQLEILGDGGILASFPLCILVEENVAAGATRSHPYFNWVHRLELKLKEKLKEAKESGLFDGPVGATPKLRIGTVTTLASGSMATATFAGTAEEPVLNLGLPKGADAKIDTTLSASGQAADAAAVGTALAGKAPAGYGLGVNTSALTAITDCDTAIVNGWYFVNKSATNTAFPGTHCAMRVDSHTTENVIQTAYCGTYTSSEFVVKQRRLWNKKWTDWDWVNPPMVLGTEYRTTERWKGKAVYVKMCDFGALPNATSKEVSYIAAGIVAEPIDWYGVYANQQAAVGSPAFSILVTQNSIIITTSSDKSMFTAQIAVKYTKQ